MSRRPLVGMTGGGPVRLPRRGGRSACHLRAEIRTDPFPVAALGAVPAPGGALAGGTQPRPRSPAAALRAPFAHRCPLLGRPD